MKEHMKQLQGELIEKIFNPFRLNKICEQYNIDLDDYLT